MSQLQSIAPLRDALHRFLLSADDKETKEVMQGLDVFLGELQDYFAPVSRQQMATPPDAGERDFARTFFDHLKASNTYWALPERGLVLEMGECRRDMEVVPNLCYLYSYNSVTQTVSAEALEEILKDNSYLISQQKIEWMGRSFYSPNIHRSWKLSEKIGDFIASVLDGMLGDSSWRSH